MNECWEKNIISSVLAVPGFQNSSYGSSPLGKQKASKLRKLKENRIGLVKLSKPSRVWDTSEHLMEKTDQPESKLRSWDRPGGLESAEASGPGGPGCLLSRGKISSCLDFSLDSQSIFPCHLSVMGGRGEHPPGMGQVSIMLSQVGRGRGHWLFWKGLGKGG